VIRYFHRLVHLIRYKLSWDTGTWIHRQDMVHELSDSFDAYSNLCRKRGGRWQGGQGLGNSTFRILYNNETSVRVYSASHCENTLRASLSNADHSRVHDALSNSLALLQMEYLDLYLVHWPQAQSHDQEWGNKALSPEQSPTVAETWAQMERLLDTGKVRSIGVSNFSIKILEEILPKAKVVPAVNQVEFHPYLPQFELKKYLDEKRIHLTAYASFGNFQVVVFENPSEPFSQASRLKVLGFPTFSAMPPFPESRKNIALPQIRSCSAGQ